MSRAVYVDLAESYDTKGFWLFSKDLCPSEDIYPITIYSDSRSQLVAANKELALDRSKVEESSANGASTWIFNKSSDAPWQKCCSESLIGSVRRVIVISTGYHKLTLERCKLYCLR